MVDPSKGMAKLERKLKRRSQPMLRSIAKLYIAHTDAYAAASVGKRERELDDRYRGLFLDFRHESDGKRRFEVTYAGESLDRYLKEYPVASALIAFAADSVLDELRRRCGPGKEQKDPNREVVKSVLFGRDSEYLFQQRSMEYPAGKPYVLLKRVEDSMPPGR